MKTSGYSGTPLAKKLGIKNHLKVRLENEPDHYFSLFADLPGDVIFTKNRNVKKDLIHYFTKSSSDLARDLPDLKNDIEQSGIIWISWPKKASKVPTNVTEDVVRAIALPIGLVDVKVCAVDEVWSGLKLVIPVKHRSPNG